MKQDLLLEPWPRHSFHNYDLGPRPHPIRRALPFYVSRMSGSRTGGVRYVHRVRSGLLHVQVDGETMGRPVEARQWLSWRLWCGQHGSSKHGEVIAEPLERSVVCATCEGRALGAGFPSSLVVTGHPVKFSPRTLTGARQLT